MGLVVLLYIINYNNENKLNVSKQMNNIEMSKLMMEDLELQIKHTQRTKTF